MSLLSEGDDQFTGTGRYVSELVRELGRRPESIQLDVLVEPRRPGRLAESPNVRLHPAAGYRAARSRAGRVAALGLATARSSRLAAQLPADVALMHFPLTLAVPLTAGLPTVQTLYDVQHHDLPEHFSRSQRLWRRLMYDRPARRATMVVTPSEHARTRAIERLGIDPERLVAIPLAVDRTRFKPTPAADDERLLGPLDLPERFLLYPASLWPHKNHARLLAALTRVGDDALDLILTGATFGKLERLERRAEAEGLGGRVRHLGRVAEQALPALYRRATAVVFPSLYEGFGAPPLEAMACGCPVASSRETSLAEVCGPAALQLDPRDIDQMAQAIERITTDAALRERLSELGLAHAARSSWQAVADAHLCVYDRAVELHSG